MVRYYVGQIVDALIKLEGVTKPRPVVIVDNDERLQQDSEFQVVIISTTPSKPIPYYHLKVDNTKTKDAQTGLTTPCWAKCNIVRTVRVSGIGRTIGYMPDDLLQEILDVYDRIYDDPNFDDLQ